MYRKIVLTRPFVLHQFPSISYSQSAFHKYLHEKGFDSFLVSAGLLAYSVLSVEVKTSWQSSQAAEDSVSGPPTPTA